MIGVGLWQLTGDKAEELGCHLRRGLTKEISEKIEVKYSEYPNTEVVYFDRLLGGCLCTKMVKIICCCLFKTPSLVPHDYRGEFVAIVVSELKLMSSKYRAPMLWASASSQCTFVQPNIGS